MAMGNGCYQLLLFDLVDDDDFTMAVIEAREYGNVQSLAVV